MGKARDLGGLTFNSQKVSLSTASGVAVTIFALPQVPFGTYIVSAGLKANDPSNYHNVAIVSAQGANTKITQLVTSDLFSLSVSGLNVQATQSSNDPQTLHAFLTRLHAE